MSAGNGRVESAIARQVALVANTISLSRQALSRQLADPRRDYAAECGYPENITPQVYQREYERNPVAARVVEVWPDECWRESPSVYEDEDPGVLTPFEEAWKNLPRQLAGRSWHRDEAGSAVLGHLKDADVKAGVGCYGVLLLGLDDGLPLSVPAAGVEESGSLPTGAAGVSPYRLSVNAAKTAGRQLLYLRSFPETLAPVLRHEANPLSPRYGQPVEYELTFGDPSSPGGALRTERVHWTRVVHVSEGDPYHAPRMRPVFDRLVDLTKVYGASAEGYWQSCFNLLAFESLPQAGADPVVDEQSIKDMIESVRNGLQREFFLAGMTVKTLPPNVVDPGPHIDKHLEAICVKLTVPLRIFKGSERGELASSQDAKSWDARVQHRRHSYTTPRVIRPFVDRLILLGVLPEPAAGYTVYWPEAETMTPGEKADAAEKRLRAVASYAAGGASLMAPADFWAKEMGYSEDEARAIVDSAAAEAERKRQEAAAALPVPAPPAVPEVPAA